MIRKIWHIYKKGFIKLTTTVIKKNQKIGKNLILLKSKKIFVFRYKWVISIWE